MTNARGWPSATGERVRERLKRKRYGYFFAWSRAVLARWKHHTRRDRVASGIGLVTLDDLSSRAPGATYRELVAPADAVAQPRGWTWPRGFVPVPRPRASRGQGVIEIPKGVVFGCRGYLGTDTATLLADGCTLWDDHERIALADAERALAVGVMPLDGLTVCAFAEGTNYAHTLLQSVPRLELFRRADALDGDRFLVNEGQRATLEALGLLGIPSSRIHRVPVRDAPVYQCERLRAATSMNGWDFGVAWSAEFLNDVFLPDPPAPDVGRRLYVGRGITRRAVRNEDDVIALLEPRGFEVVTMEDRSISEQAALFASASVVVAPHGAALANLVFARPGTTVVELMGTNSASGLYAALSWRRGLDHHVIMGTEPAPPPRWWTWRMDADTIVDMDALGRCLDGIALR